MTLNETPRSDRLHISIFGRRNVGKSSLINTLTGQQTAVVSSVKGTTTDPVYKTMELLPLGPVVFIDTAGLDDEGELGELRKKKTIEVLNKTDLAILVIDSTEEVSDQEVNITAIIKEREIPLLGVVNKIDSRSIEEKTLKAYEEKLGIKLYPLSATSGEGIQKLKKILSEAIPNEDDKLTIIGDLISPGDFVVLVVPIDKAAPKGRLILPQQQTIRDILESNAIAVVTKENELAETLKNLVKKPKMVITDSQAFMKVAEETPKDILLTSFSILFARHKGDLSELVRGARVVKNLKDGDKVLIAEACTHHQQDDDIGTVKIPRWLLQSTGKHIIIEHSSGMQFPENLSDYALIIHCGGCMLNRKAMKYRIEQARNKKVPIVNYGVLIAYVLGVLERAIIPFPLAKMVWEEEK